MKMRLYQIDPERDTGHLAFIGLDKVKDHMDCASYDCVFEGEVPCNNLEEVFEKFNVDLLGGFAGHSLSVSDVVEVTEGTEQVKPGFYFCDSFGFKEIYFDPEETQQKSLIKVVLVESGRYAKPADIDSSLEGLQQVVGGCIETYYPFKEPVCIVCNDEGKINGMDLNRGIYGEDGKLQDIIAGPFFICDCSGSSFGSLSSEQVDRYTKQFKNPERFFQKGNQIVVSYEPKVKVKEEGVR